jgi:hypothetical protein
MDKPDQIKQLYLNATRQTIRQDLARAIDILKSMSGEDERQRVAVFMDGLSQLRSEWAGGGRPKTESRHPKRR